MKSPKNARKPSPAPRRSFAAECHANRLALRRAVEAHRRRSASGGPARCEPASPKAGEAPPPKAGPPPPRSGRGTRQYDDIDVEFYLDSNEC